MLQTPLCTLLGIEFPIIQAGMGAFTSAELAAAVSNAEGAHPRLPRVISLLVFRSGRCIF